MNAAEQAAVAETNYQTEVCTCGQPRKLHADNVLARGHGRSLVRGSTCRKYTWDGKSGAFAVVVN